MGADGLSITDLRSFLRKVEVLVEVFREALIDHKKSFVQQIDELFGPVGVLVSFDFYA